MSAAKRSGTQTGVTTCVSAQHPGARWVHISLPQVMSPALEAVDVTLRIVDGAGIALPDRAQLTCGCDEILPQGTSDLGQQAWLVACEKLKIDAAVAFVGPDGKTRRLVLLD